MMAPMYCDVAGQLQGEAILARLDTEPIGNRSRVPRIRSSQMVVMFWDGCEIGGGRKCAPCCGIRKQGSRPALVSFYFTHST